MIDPKTELWIKNALLILNLVANGSITFAGLVSPQTAIAIVAVAQILISVLGSIMTAYSSSKPGPLAPADPPVVAAATRLAELPSTASAAEVNRAKSAVTNAAATHIP